MTNSIKNYTQWESLEDMGISPLSLMPQCWLMQTEVLSQRLKALSPTGYTLKLIKEQMCLLPTDEQTGFATPVLDKAWVREIYHLIDETPVIYAKTTVPDATFSLLKTELTTLNNKPIGESLLYDNPDVTRAAFSYRKISVNEVNYQGAFIGHVSTQPLWARRSLFYVKSHPLLITEVFMPTLEQFTATKARKS